MNITGTDISAALEAVRSRSPVVHNITNYVVMNNTANALLAVGASPVMAHAQEEVEEMVGIASALVINIGTLSNAWIDAMFKAARRANERGIAVILDPVGAGATSYRTRTAREFITRETPSIIRGNASEIMALYDEQSKTKGVDSAASSDQALHIARTLSEMYQCVVCISGETDYIVDRLMTVTIKNGHPMMPKVTGLGCTASALCGAFAAVMESPFAATVAAMAVMGIAGEMAATVSTGPGSMQMNFLDTLYRLSETDIRERLHIGDA